MAPTHNCDVSALKRFNTINKKQNNVQESTLPRSRYDIDNGEKKSEIGNLQKSKLKATHQGDFDIAKALTNVSHSLRKFDDCEIL